MLTAVERFKLAAISEECTNEEVERLFLNLEVSSYDELRDVLRVVAVHRPVLFETLSAKYS